VAGGIAILAAQTPGATSSLRTAGGGVVRVASNKAKATTSPTLTLTIAGGARVTAGGAISLTTRFNADAPAADDPHRVFQSVDTTSDAITFTANHGLSTGATLTYHVTGGTAAGGLVDGNSYNVIVVDDDTLLLGTEFEGAHVDPVANTITFGRTLVDSDGDPVLDENGD